MATLTSSGGRLGGRREARRGAPRRGGGGRRRAARRAGAAERRAAAAARRGPRWGPRWARRARRAGAGGAPLGAPYDSPQRSTTLSGSGLPSALRSEATMAHLGLLRVVELPPLVDDAVAVRVPLALHQAAVLVVVPGVDLVVEVGLAQLELDLPVLVDGDLVGAAVAIEVLLAAALAALVVVVDEDVEARRPCSGRRSRHTSLPPFITWMMSGLPVALDVDLHGVGRVGVARLVDDGRVALLGCWPATWPCRPRPRCWSRRPPGGRPGPGGPRPAGKQQQGCGGSSVGPRRWPGMGRQGNGEKCQAARKLSPPPPRNEQAGPFSAVSGRKTGPPDTGSD